MQLCSASICSLLDHLYAAPASVADWHRFLHQLGGLCGSQRIDLLLAPDAAPHSTALALPEQPQHRLQAVFAGRRGESLRAFDAGRHAQLLGRAAGFELARPQSSGPFSDEAIQLLRTLEPHLLRAAERQRELQQRKADGSTLGWFPALFDIPVIALDRCCAVTEISPAAKLVLELGGLRVAGATLAAADTAEETVLRRLLAQAGPLSRTQLADDPNPQFGGTALFSREGALSPLRVVLMRLGAPASENGPAALLFLQSPAQRPFPRSAQLRSLYCLNPTELRLVDQLAIGRKVKEAASAMRLTENTTRFHLKEVFRKMEVNSQTELLRTVLSIPGYADGSRRIAV